MISDYYNTKIECGQNLKELKGNDKLKRFDSFHRKEVLHYY